MAQVTAQFSGSVVAEPESKQVGPGLLEFPVYVNDQNRNKETGEYEDSGQVTKIRVKLWADLSGEDIRKGDIVEVDAVILEREYDRNDGSKGRSLETKFVNSIVVKYRRDNSSAPAQSSAPAGGFASATKGFGPSESQKGF